MIIKFSPWTRIILITIVIMLQVQAAAIVWWGYTQSNDIQKLENVDDKQHNELLDAIKQHNHNGEGNGEH